MWLRDKLPKDVPGVRVVLYGYDSHLIESDSFQTIDELGQTLSNSFELLPQGPLVFLAHSLGGILLKAAIVTTSNGQNKTLLQRLRHLFFFGVPNVGMFMSHLRSMVRDSPNQALIEQLSPDSPYLAELDSTFSLILEENKTSLTSIYETKLSRTTEVRNL
jgi:surfactin synthase thioesterase subunit